MVLDHWRYCRSIWNYFCGTNHFSLIPSNNRITISIRFICSSLVNFCNSCFQTKIFKNFIYTLNFFIFFCGISQCINTIKIEHSNNVRLEKTLDQTKKEIKKTDFIYTNITHFAWTICESYYPNINHDLFGHPEWGNWGLPERLTNLDRQRQYWLFLSSPITKQIVEDLKVQNLSAQLIVNNGFIGTGDVWVYKVIKCQ